MEKPFLIKDKVVVFKAKLKEFKDFLVRAAITGVVKEGLSNCFQAVLVVNVCVKASTSMVTKMES